jgi:hypothetical protein
MFLIRSQAPQISMSDCISWFKIMSWSPFIYYDFLIIRCSNLFAIRDRVIFDITNNSKFNLFICFDFAALSLN